jgi:hypothetical protein
VVILKKETLEDEPIQDFDVRFDVIKSDFEPIMQQMARLKEAGLTKKYEKAREKLELLRFDRDELKSDHKEERWLAVFRKVADQVDVMMEGLDKSIIQCSGPVQQIIKSQQQQQYNNTFDKLSKSFFKAFHAPTSNSSIKPADKEKFRAAEKSFEAKYKYYTPSIDRMLAMLGNGIATRASKDQATIQRHDEMIQRWQQLKHAADTLREHDLIEAARILHPTTTNTNSNTSNWKTIRYRTPTPSNEHKPYKTPTPTNSDSHPQLIRSSTSDSSSVSSISSGYFRTYRHFNTSSSNRRDEFYEQDEQEYGVDLVRKRSASVDKQQPAVTDVITTNTRYRSKSSMGNINRAMSPPRQRSFTPSLIPRPKTPNSDSRATSPLSPRPRSAQREMIPPVPFLEPATKKKFINQEYIYKPDKNDALDVEISHIVNTSPVVIECQRAQPGRYYFGNEASVSSIAGKKLYACKLMTYKDRKNGQFKRNKVLVRVGGGWQDLEFFLLEHSSFMSETSV